MPGLYPDPSPRLHWSSLQLDVSCLEVPRMCSHLRSFLQASVSLWLSLWPMADRVAFVQALRALARSAKARVEELLLARGDRLKY